MTEKRISMAHGSGGTASRTLYEDIFFSHLKDPSLVPGDDGADLDLPSENISFTTDSFVISPAFFSGGNIGKLAVCGTVNDLAVNGSVPYALSCGFILEEGFLISDLEKIVRSMAEEAEKAGVRIVTGDTKVVEKGSADGIFINTAGIGIRKRDLNASLISSGDSVILTGTMGDHGMAVVAARKEISLETDLKSDCACLNRPLNSLLDLPGLRFMRDPSRGGVATVLNELAVSSGKSIHIEEDLLPVSEDVSSACELLGFDPLYVANEGKAVVIISRENEAECLKRLKEDEATSQAVRIGTVKEDPAGRVILKTSLQTERILNMLTGDQIPRIC